MAFAPEKGDAISELGHEATFPSDKRMSALACKSGPLSFDEYTP